MDDLVLQEVRKIIADTSVVLNSETALLGDGRIVDSMGLVELCLRLEDIAISIGFDFDWTSDTAMSRSRSMFRTIGALQSEFTRQKSGKA